MSEKDKIEHWIETAEYDLKTAEAMLETKRFLYVGFMCHLVIEKLFKAYFIKVFKKDPPYTHNLRLLAEETNLLISLDDHQKDFIDFIQPFNIRARYPVEKDSLYRLLDLKKCRDITNKTKELSKWIKSRL
jgi:HEPN domain-containing protein